MKLKIGDAVQCNKTNAQWLITSITPVSEGKEWYHMRLISECAHQGVYEEKVDQFYTKLELGSQVANPLSEKAFLDIRGAFVSLMNDPTVTDQEKMGVDLCLMALDAYYDYKNDFNLKVQYPVKEDVE